MSEMVAGLPPVLSPAAWWDLAEVALTLVDASLKATVLILAVGALSRLVGSEAPSLRHTLWAGCLITCLALPLAPHALSWRLAELELPVPDTQPVAGYLEARTGAPAGAGVGSDSPADEWNGLPRAGVDGEPGDPSRRRAAAGRNGWLATAYLFLVSVWLCGFTLRLGREAAGWVSLAWMTRRAHPPHDTGRVSTEVSHVAHHAPDRTLLGRRVRIRVSSETSVPLSWGLLRPVVLLPTRARQWPEDMIRATLVHEMAHIRRFDQATHLLAAFAEAVFWFHPLISRAARFLRLEAERACDAVVLESGSSGRRYARHLLTVARTARRDSSGRRRAMALLGRYDGFETRIRAVLNPFATREATSLWRRSAIWCAAIAAILASPVARVAPRVTIPEPPHGLLERTLVDPDPTQGTIRWRDGDRRLRASWSLERTIVPAADERSLVRIAPGGFVLIGVAEGGRRLELDVVGTEDGMLTTAHENGTALGSTEASERLATLLPATLLRTPIGADTRAARALGRGGVGEALAEATSLRTDWARKIYLDAILACCAATGPSHGPDASSHLPQLTRADRLNVLGTAVKHLKAESWLGRFLWQQADVFFESSAERRAFITAVRTLENHDDVAAVVSRVTDHPRLKDTERASLLDAVRRESGT